MATDTEARNTDTPAQQAVSCPSNCLDDFAPHAQKVIYCLLVVRHALDLKHVLLTWFVLVLRQVCVQVPTLTLVTCFAGVRAPADPDARDVHVLRCRCACMCRP